MFNARHTAAFAIATTACIFALGAAASAQEMDAGLETITVTARKVDEKLQEVPLAITAVTAEAIERAGITSLAGIAALTPGLSMNDPGTEQGFVTSPVIRGTPNISGGGGDPNVSVFLDGVYLANPSVISLGLVGIERVEVIKGPVSALYGRNAFAGAINYVSKRAPESFAGDVALTVGSDGQRTATFSVGGPLIEGKFSARLAGAYDEFDGTYRDSVNGLARGGREKKNAMLSFAFTPTDEFEVTGAWYHADDFFDDPALVYTDNNCGPLVAAGAYAGQFQRYCGEVNYRQRPLEVADIPAAAGSSGNQRKVDAVSVRAAYDFGWGELSGIAGYNKVTAQYFADFTGRRDGIGFALSPGPGFVNLLEIFGSDFNNDDSSVELRLASSQDQALRWALGGYYYDASSTTTTIIGIDGSRLPPGQGIAGAVPNFFLTSNGQPSTTNFTQTDNTDKLSSYFGSLEYDIIENVTGTIELRHTSQDKTQDIIRNSFIPNVVRPLGRFPGQNWSYSNYHAALRWQVTPAAMLYVSAGNGTKAGGFNQRATFASEVSFGPEKSRAYEIGAKTSWLDNRLQLNVAIYDNKTTDMQFSGASDDPTNVGLVTKNFGGTENRGFEIEVGARPVPQLLLNVGYAYTNPKFIAQTYDFTNAALCIALPTCDDSRVVTGLVSASGVVRSAVDLVGIRPVRVSKNTLSASAEYSFEVVEGYEWLNRIDYRYESKQNASDNTALGTLQLPARSIANFNSRITHGPYDVVLYVNNLTNNTVPAATSFAVRLNDFVGNPVSQLAPLRTYGVTFRYSF